ncbi:MAG TPA: MATE family efflux transporter [Candidatus Eisenbergiella merdavium]|uniref:MATE family efflux transporter n=1 Tax=Candidatus Eisenbergiella merdavium TaxID=2838551 RepID=A0A9D2SRZ0_9FIRM|nr:MATE family efflux transporter [Candidatus Eisenbergiella merdavium]
MKAKSYEIDMCNGPLTGKLLKFSLPLMLSGILQLLFNAADIIVVGRFAGHQALAAVGSTGSLINLLVNVFIGLSVGANVMAGNYIGAKEEKAVSETVHTAVLISLICGVGLIFIGVLLAGPLLALMGTPEDVLGQAALYMRIYFVGMPATMLYNFGAAILRATGDTRRPLYYLFASGIINVILNLVLVIVFHLGVAGVAIATVISQCISALLVLRCLMHDDAMYRLHLDKLKIHKSRLILMIRIGLPAGMQGAVFSISNVLIQSSVNSFGSVAMAGNTAASNIEGFIYTSMNAFHQTAISFTSQNYGAGKKERINRILIQCELLVFIVGFVMGNLAFLFGDKLLTIYSTDRDVIEYGLIRMGVICTTYFLCGMMDVFVGSLRGLNYAVLPMIVSVVGACGLRILWIFTVFQWNRSLFVLYLSYPVTWFITAAAHLVCYIIVKRNLDKKENYGLGI